MFNNFFQQYLNRNKLTYSIAFAHDEEVILSVKEALKYNFAKFILIGDQNKIEDLLDVHEISHEHIKIIHENNQIEACRKAVLEVHSGNAQILMKGMVATADILRAVLDKEIGLRSGKLLSHVAVFKVPDYPRYLIITDAAMNINPTLEQKGYIIENAIYVAKGLNIDLPKIAVITAVENVNPDMLSTIDAALLAKMAERGQIKGALIDGPLALDNAISLEAKKVKNIKSEVAGQADILLLPNIEVGNVLYKSLVYFAKAEVGAIIAGAKAPIVLTSRADSYETKLNSMILAAIIASKNTN